MKYFVSTDGDDAQTGTLERPFRTLERASKQLHPGDECIVRGGVYRETLRPARSGQPGKPITFRAFENETPLLSAGTTLEDWRREGDGFWSAIMPVDLGDGNQVFADERVLSEARWPTNEGDLFAPTRASASMGTDTTLTDPKLSGDRDSWNGAVLWCAGGAKWICWAGAVTNFDPDRHTLTFAYDKAQNSFYTPCEGSEYVLMNARAALTDPFEWWLDRETGRLWIILPEGSSPKSTDDGAVSRATVVTVKARRTAIDLSGLAHIHLRGLHIRGGGLRTDSDSRNLRLERLCGEYLAHSYTRDVSDDAVLIDGEGHVLLECDFGYSSGSVLSLRGARTKLLGNHFHHGNYGGLWKGTVALSGRKHVFAYNTARHSGRDLLSIHGLTESLIEHNDLSHAGWLTHDLGITYGHNTDFGGTIIRRNWVHDCLAEGLAEGIYFDHCSHNVIVYENLIWNIPGMPIQVNNPGHFNLIAHNSCQNTNIARPKTTSFDHSHRQDLFGCHFLNNLTNGPFELPDSAFVGGNSVSKAPEYMNANESDFRLAAEFQNEKPVIPINGLCDDVSAFAGAVQKGRLSWSAGVDGNTPIDESVEWEKPDWAYVNRLDNAAFELGSLEGWQASHEGVATIVPGNGWGNEVSGTGNEPTGTSFYELEIFGESYIEQNVEALPSNTRFRLSGWVRADSAGATVVMEASGSGFNTVSAESRKSSWTRLIVEFTTGSKPTTVVVRISQRTDGADARSCRGRADNFGLIEAD
jgi:hypothetical protein